jgi:hypothetical protein
MADAGTYLERSLSRHSSLSQPFVPVQVRPERDACRSLLREHLDRSTVTPSDFRSFADACAALDSASDEVS